MSITTVTRRVAVLICLLGAAFIPRAYCASAVYAATDQGVFKSTDNGVTWVWLGDKMKSPSPLLTLEYKAAPSVGAVAVDPGDANVVYAAAEFFGGGALMKTTDGGQTWTGVAMGISLNFNGSASNPFQVTLSIDPVATGVLYLWNGYLWQSRDGGNTWKKLYPATQQWAGVESFAVDPQTSGVAYAVAADNSGLGFYKTVDFATSWTRLSTISSPGAGFAYSLHANYELFVDPQDTSKVYMTSSYMSPSGLFQGVFKSADGGLTWRDLQIPGTFQNMIRDPGYGNLLLGDSAGPARLLASSDGDLWTPRSNQVTGLIYGPALAADTEEGAVVFSMAGPALSRSTDGGATWTEGGIDPDCPSGDCPWLRGWPHIFGLAVPSAPKAPLNNVSAASFRGGQLAPESIASALGTRLATETATNTTDPPPTELGGSTVTVTDSKNASRIAPLFYVSPGQINYMVPAGTAIGAATVRIRGAGIDVSQTVQIADVAPGIFTLNRTGLAAAAVVRVSGGVQTYEDVYQLDSLGKVIAKPINPGLPSDKVFLTLYGTGIRNAGTSGVTVTVNGTLAGVDYAGAQGGFAGLDQINIRLLPEMGHGDVEVMVQAKGQAANTVHLTLK